MLILPVSSNALSEQQLKSVRVPHTPPPFHGGGGRGGGRGRTLRILASITSKVYNKNYNGQSMRQQTCETHDMAEKAQ